MFKSLPKEIDEKELKRLILDGKILIYPTDTIYGIGCNAENKEAVEKIREIKKRDMKPFSVIAPDFEWIKNNLLIDVNLSDYLPGKYTIILKKKNSGLLSWVSNSDTLGIRIPRNEFCDKIRKSGLPFITTSVNLSGEKPIIEINELREEIKSQVDIIIDSGKLDGKPSKLVINGKIIEKFKYVKSHI